VLTALASVYALRLADADLWGHLRYGRLILDNGGRIPEDPFAYTTAGQHWNDHESLSQVLFWLAYAHGGPGGLILLKCLVGGATIACLYSCLRLSLSDARLWGPLLILTAVGLGRWLLFRPQLFTFLFLGFTLRLLFGHLLGRRAPLWLLPLLMPLQVNLHGGFLAGLGVLGLGLGLRLVQGFNRHGLALAGLWRAVWPLTLTLLACLAATLLNPLGWRLWPYLRTELGFQPNRLYIQEWLPLSFAGPQLWSALLVVIPLGILLVAGAVAQKQGQRIADVAPWQWLLSALPLTILAFTSNRHSPILILWLAPLLSLLVGAATKGREGQPAWVVGVGLLWAVATLPALLMISLVTADPRPRITVPAEARAPAGLIAFLRANDLHGNLYAPLWWGSSLTWEMESQIRVALDGRNVTLFAPQDVAANLVFYHEPDAATDTPRRYPTDYLALSTDTPVLERLRADDNWVSLFQDGEFVLFVRNDAEHAELVRRARAGELVPGEARAERYLE
jgi:hypothetical protein